MQHRHMWEHFVFITGEEEEDGLRAIKDTLKEWKMSKKILVFYQN